MSIQTTCLIVSVDYSDYLSQTLKHNSMQFTDTIVITSPNDLETQNVCKNYAIKFITTDAFWKNNSIFNKAAALNEGLLHVRTEFICTVDADTILPNIRPALERLDRNYLYGLNRVVYLTQNDFLSDRGENRHMPKDYIIGFFQLFSRESPYFPGGFSEDYLNAGHYDIEFTSYWPLHKRRHIVNEPAKHIGERGKNWHGRNRPNPGSFVLKGVAPSSIRASFSSTSSTLLVQNVSAEDINHIKLHTSVQDGQKTSYRLGTLKGGDYVEFPSDKLSEVEVIGIDSNGNLIKIRLLNDELTHS